MSLCNLVVKLRIRMVCRLHWSFIIVWCTSMNQIKNELTTMPSPFSSVKQSNVFALEHKKIRSKRCVLCLACAVHIYVCVNESKQGLSSDKIGTQSFVLILIFFSRVHDAFYSLTVILRDALLSDNFACI